MTGLQAKTETSLLSKKKEAELTTRREQLAGEGLGKRGSERSMWEDACSPSDPWRVALGTASSGALSSDAVGGRSPADLIITPPFSEVEKEAAFGGTEWTWMLPLGLCDRDVPPASPGVVLSAARSAACPCCVCAGATRWLPQRPAVLVSLRITSCARI
ncbi:hypothetical protein Anapl_14630 [Anas platyrhynchos]|uniref:Uncharacterized protein n=1 Tax=Anas platyrhynchos TaxID=8839 RepID=R0KZU3_ANAPL|nr:hypothetical protein Anapl_14630 [Anas platyrhynchos]